MKAAFHNRTPISIFYFTLLTTSILLPFNPTHAFDIKPQREVIIQEQSSTEIQFRINMNLENVLYTWMGTDLFVICGAAYNSSQEYNIIGKKTLTGALNDGDYNNLVEVPITQFNSKPVGKSPTKALCFAYAKNGNQCNALAGVGKGIISSDIPQELQSISCDDITLPAP